MKKLLLLLAAALAFGPAAAQTTTAASLACCARPAPASATEAFAMLATEKDFSGGHDAPLPYTYAGEGQMITFKTSDGQPGHAFEIKSAKPSTKYLLVIHEWWGLNDYIKKEAAMYAQEMPDVNIMALDLYDGQVATTPEEAGKLMQGVKTERATAIIKGAQQYAGPQSAVCQHRLVLRRRLEPAGRPARRQANRGLRDVLRDAREGRGPAQGPEFRRVGPVRGAG